MSDSPKHLSLKSLYAAIQRKMEASQRLHREHSIHKGETGEACESLWIDLLKEYLPNRYKVNSGFVIDSNEKYSQQQDLIIYDRQYSPFVLREDGLIYIPAESVYAVFEVKQDLSKEHLEYAAEKARSVRVLHRTSAKINHAGGVFKPRPPFPIPAGLLTLSSTWSPPLGETFDSHFLRLSEDNATCLQLGCTLDAGGYRLVGTDNDYSIVKSQPDISLMYFLLSLFHTLQQLGTVPAIDVPQYLRWVE